MEPDREEKSRGIPAGIWLFYKRGFTFGQWGWAHPYYWSETEERPMMRTWKGNVNLWIFNVLVTYAYSAFVLFRCIQKTLDPEARDGIKIYLRLTVLYYALPSLFNTFFILRRSSVLELANHAVRNMKWIEANMEFDARHLLGRCQFFMACIYYGFIGMSIFITLFAFAFPNSPEMISSVVPDRSLSTRIACGLFQGYIEYTCHSQCFINTFLFFACLFPSWAVLAEIKTWIGADLTGRRENRFVRIYNSVRFLIKMACDVYLTLLVPVVKATLLGLVVYCVYSAARLSGFVALGLGLLGLVVTAFMVVSFGTMAEVHALSEEIRSKLKRLTEQCNRRTRLGKRLRSLTPVMFRMNSSYFVDRMLAITIIDTVVGSSIDFLIANPA